MHNAIAGATVGFLGVSRGVIGVPFINPWQLHSMRSPALIGAAVYGAMGGALAAIGGKPI